MCTKEECKIFYFEGVMAEQERIFKHMDELVLKMQEDLPPEIRYMKNIQPVIAKLIYEIKKQLELPNYES